MNFFKPEQTLTSVEVLAMVRHGDYERTQQHDWKDGPLTPSAIGEVKSMGMQLKECLSGLEYLEAGKTIMVTSDAVRARETARILREILGIECLAYAALGLNSRGDEYLESDVLKSLKNLIAPNGGYQGLVVVSHMGNTADLPPALHSMVSGKQNTLNYANAAVYDTKGKVIYIHP